MQDHGLGQMLQILQSPMGAALIPQMNQRENLVMDRGNADLQAVITRTASEQQDAARRQEMHPLDMDAKRTSTAGQQLVNQGRQNELGVFEGRGGVPGAVQRAEEDRTEDQKKKDFDIFQKGLKTFRESSSIVGMAPIGSKRQTAIDLFRRSQMPDSVIAAIQNIPEDKIDAEIAATVKRMNEAAEKFAVADLRETNQNTRTAATINGRLDVERLRQQGAQAVAQLRAAAAQMKASAGKDPKALNTSQRFADLSVRLENALRDGNMEEANFLLGLSRDLALASKAKPERPAGVTEETIRDRDGNVIISTTKGPAKPADPSTEGWGTPRMR